MSFLHLKMPVKKILTDKKYSENEDYKTTLEKESEKENIDTKTELKS